jgi:hypothetical protein
VGTATQRGYAIYAALPDKASEMRVAGFDIRGTLDDLLREARLAL